MADSKQISAETRDESHRRGPAVDGIVGIVGAWDDGRAGFEWLESDSYLLRDAEIDYIGQRMTEGE